MIYQTNQYILKVWILKVYKSYNDIFRGRIILYTFLVLDECNVIHYKSLFNVSNNSWRVGRFFKFCKNNFEIYNLFVCNLINIKTFKQSEDKVIVLNSLYIWKWIGRVHVSYRNSDVATWNVILNIFQNPKDHYLWL